MHHDAQKFRRTTRPWRALRRTGAPSKVVSVKTAAGRPTSGEGMARGSVRKAYARSPSKGSAASGASQRSRRLTAGAWPRVRRIGARRPSAGSGEAPGS